MRVDRGNGINNIGGMQNTKKSYGYFSEVLNKKLQEDMQTNKKADNFIHTDNVLKTVYSDYKNSIIDENNRNYERFRFIIDENGSIMINDDKTGKEITVDPVQQNSVKEAEEALKEETGEESEIKSDILVKPDGSRVLVMIIKIGGMECSTSVEISKPTDLPNRDTSEKLNDTDEFKLDISDLQR